MRSLLVHSMRVALVFSGCLGFAPDLHALTVDEVIRLVEAGVEDRTIQMLMEQEKANRKGANGVGVREITRPDGGRDIVYYSTSTSEEMRRTNEEERRKIDQALEVLRNVEIYHRR